MELCVLARVLELIEKYLRTRTGIAQEILGPDSTRLQNACGGKLKQENSAHEITSFANFNKNRPVHRKRTQIDFISFSVFSSGNSDVDLYACAGWSDTKKAAWKEVWKPKTATWNRKKGQPDAPAPVFVDKKKRALEKLGKFNYAGTLSEHAKD